MISETDIAYIAGLFDGEEALLIRSIKNVKRKAIKLIIIIVGVSLWR